jgi:hypothetical protein
VFVGNARESLRCNQERIEVAADRISSKGALGGMIQRVVVLVNVELGEGVVVDAEVIYISNHFIIACMTAL